MSSTASAESSASSSCCDPHHANTILLAETSFNPEQTEMIAKAFDDAWTLLQIDEAEPAMASLVRTALAKGIIEMAQRPGVDVQKLRDDAIAYVKNNPLWPTP